MMQKATKANENVYYQARIRAAAYNDLLSSREGASNIVCIERTRLANIELGNINPHPEEVNLMTNSYNAPELQNYYCSQQCPLGCGRVDRLTPRSLEGAALKIGRVTRDIGNIVDVISDIAEDGRITAEERPLFDRSMEQLIALKNSIEELMLVSDKSNKNNEQDE